MSHEALDPNVVTLLTLCKIPRIEFLQMTFWPHSDTLSQRERISAVSLVGI